MTTPSNMDVTNCYFFDSSAGSPHIFQCFYYDYGDSKDRIFDYHGQGGEHFKVIYSRVEGRITLSPTGEPMTSASAPPGFQGLECMRGLRTNNLYCIDGVDLCM